MKKKFFKNLFEKENNLQMYSINEFNVFRDIISFSKIEVYKEMKLILNDIDKNILVIKESSYPDVEKGNLIIAGHSGNSWRAFFNDLYKLSKGDYAYVTYKNKKYAYKIVNIYKQDKVGTIGIYRDYNKTTLTLVTCTNYESTTQTVYIAELQEVTDN